MVGTFCMILKIMMLLAAGHAILEMGMGKTVMKKHSVSKEELNPATQNNKIFPSLLNFLGTVMLGRRCLNRRQK